MVKAIVIVWTEDLEQHMRDAFEYISEDSPKNAMKVIEDIIEAVNKRLKTQRFTLPINID